MATMIRHDVGTTEDFSTMVIHDTNSIVHKPKAPINTKFDTTVV